MSLDSELENALEATDGAPDDVAADDVAVSQAVVSDVTLTKAAPPKKKGNVALLVALVAMAAGVVTLFLVGFKEASIYEVPTDEVVAQASKLEGRRLRVGGELVPGTLKKREDGCEYRFRMQSKGKEIAVRYARCEIPDTFRDRPEGGVMVTVEGQLAKGGDTLEAANVMAKCASKYDPKTHTVSSGAPSDGSAPDMTQSP